MPNEASLPLLDRADQAGEGRQTVGGTSRRVLPMIMRRTVFLAALLALSAAFAGRPVPLAHWMLADGEGLAIADGGPESWGGKIVHSENSAWGQGRGSAKALFFLDHPLHQAATVAITPGDRFEYDKGFSASCWIQVSTESQRAKTYEILNLADSERGRGFRLVYAWESLMFFGGDGKKAHAVKSTPSKHPIERGVWNHVAATFDGLQARIYLNGQLVGASPDGQPFVLLPAATRVLSIGSYREGYAYGFRGAIADVKLFGRALTPVEVMAEAKSLRLDD